MAARAINRKLNAAERQVKRQAAAPPRRAPPPARRAQGGQRRPTGAPGPWGRLLLDPFNAPNAGPPDDEVEACWHPSSLLSDTAVMYDAITEAEAGTGSNQKFPSQTRTSMLVVSPYVGNACAWYNLDSVSGKWTESSYGEVTSPPSTDKAMTPGANGKIAAGPTVNGAANMLSIFPGWNASNTSRATATKVARNYARCTGIGVFMNIVIPDIYCQGEFHVGMRPLVDPRSTHPDRDPSNDHESDLEQYYQFESETLDTTIRSLKEYDKFTINSQNKTISARWQPKGVPDKVPATAGMVSGTTGDYNTDGTKWNMRNPHGYGLVNQQKQPCLCIIIAGIQGSFHASTGNPSRTDGYNVEFSVRHNWQIRPNSVFEIATKTRFTEMHGGELDNDINTSIKAPIAATGTHYSRHPGLMRDWHRARTHGRFHGDHHLGVRGQLALAAPSGFGGGGGSTSGGVALTGESWVYENELAKTQPHTDLGETGKKWAHTDDWVMKQGQPAQIDPSWAKAHGLPADYKYTTAAQFEADLSKTDKQKHPSSHSLAKIVRNVSLIPKAMFGLTKGKETREAAGGAADLTASLNPLASAPSAGLAGVVTGGKDSRDRLGESAEPNHLWSPSRHVPMSGRKDAQTHGIEHTISHILQNHPSTRAPQPGGIMPAERAALDLAADYWGDRGSSVGHEGETDGYTEVHLHPADGSLVGYTPDTEPETVVGLNP